MISLNSHNNQIRVLLASNLFRDKKTKAQRGKDTCLRLVRESGSLAPSL